MCIGMLCHGTALFVVPLESNRCQIYECRGISRQSIVRDVCRTMLRVVITSRGWPGEAACVQAVKVRSLN